MWDRGATPVRLRVAPEVALKRSTRLWLLARTDGRWRTLHVPVNRTTEGVFVVETTVSELLGGSGADRLRIIVVSSGATLPPDGSPPPGAWSVERSLEVR